MNSSIPLINISETKPQIVGSTDKIYVRNITGFYQKIRAVSLSILLVMYFAFGWIDVGGQQLILFDIGARKFHLFGITFWPQDFTLLTFALIISAYGLFFITSLFGRIWCGYSCPQTVWSFMFIWLEELFEGSRNQRIKLDKSPVSFQKIVKKTGKHLSWILLALATAITFVGYFYPIRTLSLDIITLSLTSGWAIFWIIFFTLATYINAGWLRELVCIYMCPYARFQSAMFSENTLIVGYDKRRGEPRGSRSRVEGREALGDCVDCQICVQVCPTGIDIRDGLQYECIGCALCIDACDNIMEKMNYPKGLIRYASEKEFIHGKRAFKLDFKSLAYGSILLVSMLAFAILLYQRPLTALSISRDRGALYFQNGMGMIENSYTLKIINKREIRDMFTLSINDLGARIFPDTAFSVGPGEQVTRPITVSLDPEKITNSSSEIIFEIQSTSAPEIHASTSSNFLSPLKKLEKGYVDAKE